MSKGAWYSLHWNLLERVKKYCTLESTRQGSFALANHGVSLHVQQQFMIELGIRIVPKLGTTP